MGNPSLCPAFRVRRGKYREYGLVSGRARRATRPTPSEFRCHVGMAPTSAAGSVPGDTLPPASPCAPPLPRPSLGTRSESGGDADGTDGNGRGAQGRDRKQRRRARPYDQCHQARSRPQQRRLRPGVGPEVSAGWTADLKGDVRGRWILYPTRPRAFSPRLHFKRHLG